jgi:uncharacterized protein YecE (DUF72 family)
MTSPSPAASGSVRPGGRVRVGTCSWTDKTMIAAWYPAQIKSAADRLAYYAGHFGTVEVDSTFYGLPSERVSRLWAERTPPRFTFHIKAFAMLTRHGVRPEQLPPELRQAFPLELDRYGRIVHPDKGLRRATFEWYSRALEPLREADKLGLTLLQFPPYFTATDSNIRYIEEALALLGPDRVAVEFRHASWVDEDHLRTTLRLLERLSASYVCVDEPRIDSPSVLPPLAAATADIAYVRFHGRNQASWNARVDSASERFRYLYTEDELSEWVDPIKQLQKSATVTFVMFNNCHADYAPRNARQMMTLLDLLAATEPVTE